MSPLAIALDNLSAARHIVHIVQQPSFCRLYNKTTDHTVIDQAILDLNVDLFDKWMLDNGELYDLSIRALRDLASIKHVKQYGSMTKSELVQGIKNAM